MIRPLRLFPLLLCLLLTGCNTAAAVGQRPIAVGFSCTAAGRYHGNEVAGKVERSSAGLLTLTLTKPDELNGLTMTWDGQTVTLDMLGLKWSLSPEKVPSAALGRRLLQALDAVVYTTADGVLTEDGRHKTTGELEGGITYTLYSDPETGALLSLEVPKEELYLTFADFTAV
ncbi:MAG: hypothetical protein E7552_06575 [Ruminococcaceae bacterium]|nr:hypothetical protein [Oscillospiraceae bacterium]